MSMSGLETTGEAVALNELSLQGGLQTTTRPEKKRGKFRIAALLVALSLSLLVPALNATIIATAIPTISSQFNSAAGYVWIGSANLLANAASGPLWVKLSDIWGRKPVMLILLAWFFASTVVCALSVNMDMLIAGRVLQGIASGGLLEMDLIIVSDIFSMRLRSLFFGLLEAIWAVAGAAGPTLGGAFTELLSWRYCFWVTLPICGVAFVLHLIFLDVHNPRTPMAQGLKAVDWLGSLTLVGMVLLILLGLDFGGAIFPWDSPKVICLIVFGALCSLFFYISEKRWAKYPVIPFQVFESRSNVMGFLVCFLQGFVFIGGEYYLPLFFQSAKEASPLRSGILLVPTTISEAFAGIFTGIFIHRTGRYQELMWIGTLLMTVGNGLYINFNVDTSIGAIIAFQAVAGLGCGLLFEPPLIAVQANVPQDDIATASATMGMVRNIAIAMSIVIAGVVFQNGMNLRANSLEQAGVPSSLIADVAGDAAAANLGEIPNIKNSAHQRAVKEAYAWSLRNNWIMFTCVAFLAFVASLFVRKYTLSREHTETTTGLKKEKQEVSPSRGQEAA